MAATSSPTTKTAPNINPTHKASKKKKKKARQKETESSSRLRLQLSKWLG